MSSYICKCGRRVQKSISADNTGNRLKGYGPGHECYGCPYAMPWGGNKWDETAKRFVRDIKGYECRTSRTLSYDSHFIGSTKDKCTCSVVSLDFDFLEQISTWVKDTFPLGELTGSFSRDELRPTDYSHNGRYCCTFTCAANKKGISAKAALLAQFFTPDGSRKDMTPQQEMEKILSDIKKATCSELPQTTEAEFVQLNDCEVTPEMAEALKNAVPCKNAPIDPVEESPTSSAQCSDAATAAESPTAASPVLPEASSPTTETAAVVQSAVAPGDAGEKAAAQSVTFSSSLDKTVAPTFDYSSLDTQTVDVLHMAENQYTRGKKMAETGLRWMVNAVSMAHDALCSTVVQQLDNGKFAPKEDTFRAWCESIGISRSSAYNLLRVAERFGNIEVDGKSILDVQPATLLYEAAKPSAPADMVRKVETCEITSSAEYRAVLKENQQLRTDRVNAMNQAEREKSRADAAEAREEEAWTAQSKAEARAQEAEKQLSGSRQVAEAAKRRADKWQAEAEAARKQPIEAVVDEDEVERRANQKAHDIAEDLAADMTAELRDQLEQATSGSEQDARSAYDSLLLAGRNLTNIWLMVKPLISKIKPSQRRFVLDQLIRPAKMIVEEAEKCL